MSQKDRVKANMKQQTSLLDGHYELVALRLEQKQRTEEALPSRGEQFGRGIRDTSVYSRAERSTVQMALVSLAGFELELSLIGQVTSYFIDSKTYFPPLPGMFSSLPLSLCIAGSSSTF